MLRNLETGDIIDGKYRVERVLGRGGMGIVVEATHLTLGTTVAIKVLSRRAGANERVERLVREAQTAARLRSEHVVRVFDVGLLEGGAPYVVMEHLEGRSLHEALYSNGPLPVRRCINIVLEICDALVEAHGLGIVHRDLKPPNLFMARQPNGREVVKVLDFGIAKLVEDAPASDGPVPLAELTGGSTFFGTPQYMAPEQFERDPKISPAADLWAVGVIFYELLTGRRPFGGRHLAEIVWRVTLTAPVAPHELRPEIPPAVEAIVMRCLRRQASERYASVEELVNDLTPLAAEPQASTSNPRVTPAPVFDKTVLLPRSSTPPAIATPAASPVVVAAPKRRRDRTFAATLGLVVALTGVTAAVALPSRGPAAATGSSGASSPSTSPVPAPVVVIRGSATVAELAGPWSAALGAMRHDLAFRYEPSSSTAGLGALTRGEVDVAGASRPATAEERAQAMTLGVTLVEHVIAKDSLAVVVNPENPVSELSIEQLRSVLTGGVRSWAALGGKNRAISVLAPADERGSHEVVKSVVFREGDDFSGEAERVRRGVNVTERVMRDPSAIGIVASHGVGAAKVLRLHGPGAKAVAPSAATVRAGSYPLRRDLFIYTRADASPATAELVAFLLGPGQRVVAEAGFVPVR